MHIAEVVTIAKSLPQLRLNTYKSLILSYSADYRRIFQKNRGPAGNFSLFFPMSLGVWKIGKSKKRGGKNRPAPYGMGRNALPEIRSEIKSGISTGCDRNRRRCRRSLRHGCRRNRLRDCRRSRPKSAPRGDEPR